VGKHGFVMVERKLIPWPAENGGGKREIGVWEKVIAGGLHL
jgi:hypothetical protein